MNFIIQYNEKIKSGDIVVGQWIRKLYAKLSSGIADGTYVFDEDRANDVIDYIETHCYHTEGPLAPGPFKLELWQKALLSAMFGIMDPDNGKRMFRESVLIVSRKNGKSLFASAVAKYLLYNGEYGTRIFCTAPKLDQADIIYDSIWLMIQKDPEWQAEEMAIRDGIKGHNKTEADEEIIAGHARKRVKDIYISSTNSSIKKIAFSERKTDGYNPSLAICDEISSWSGDKGLKQYEVLKSGMGAREIGDNPSILLSCSTAGYINDSIYDELIKRSTHFLLGDSKEKRLLPFLYMVDDPEKWNDINELRKSNPNLGVSVSVDYLLEEIAVAEGSYSKRAEFLTKYCNIKQNSSIAWLDTADVNKAYGEPLHLQDFQNSYCVGGIDLSRTTDLTSCCIVVEKDGELYVFSKFFLPAERVDDASVRDNLPYRSYIQRGELIPSGDNFIDYHDCFNWFKELVEQYQILPLQVGYDRYCAQYLVQDMEQYGFHMDNVFQGTNLTSTIREFEGTLKDKRIHIGNNDLLKVHLLNSALKQETETERCKLVKISANDHVDGMAALLDAFCVRQKWYSDIGQQLKNEEG